jgi:uncharacterized protein (TIGR02284 family)
MRTVTHSDVVTTNLNSLIQANRDSEEGFRTAADAVAEEDLPTVLHRYAQQRARFAAELEQEVRTFGGEPDTSGSATGSVRNAWLSLKSAVSGGDAAAILASCENAEEATLSEYEDVLKEDLPDYLKEMVRQQHDEVQESIQHIRALRQAESS